MKIKTTLSRKVCISIGLIFILLLAVIYYLSEAIVQTGFARLEQQQITTNLVRLQKSIEGELDNLSLICGDWTPWDDTRDFMLGQKPEYVSSNLTAECISNLKLNFMMFIDNNGKILHTSVVNPQEKVFLELPDELSQFIVSHKELLDLTEPDESKSGLLILRDTIVLAASQPISNSQSQKPISGILVVGRFLDDTKIEALKEQTCLNIKLAAPDINERELFANSNMAVQVADANTISGYTKIFDICGDRHITLRIDMPRNIFNYGKSIIFYFMITMAATAILTMTGLIFTMKKIVLKPLNSLITNFNYIEHDYNISTKLYTDRQDEIGVLARSFDSMMNHLNQRMLELAEKQKTTNSLNAELMQTTEKLQQANTELKSFVYVASHDLREPLRKIVVFGDMLKESLKDKIQGPDSENLHFMIDGAERMKKMIDGLLLYSRVSTQPHPLQRVDMNEILIQLCKFELGVLLEERNVIIEKPQPLPIVVADPSQLTQLLQNLIANGIKYQPKGNQPRITITPKPAPDGMVKIEVKDNGIGIKSEYHSAVFTMFKRLHSKEQYEGTGIGLSVCKKIVERHNGQIGVESQFGEGSTFWFTIKEVPAAVTASV